jgi:hypothetical protein
VYYLFIGIFTEIYAGMAQPRQSRHMHRLTTFLREANPWAHDDISRRAVAKASSISFGELGTIGAPKLRYLPWPRFESREIERAYMKYYIK